MITEMKFRQYILKICESTRSFLFFVHFFIKIEISKWVNTLCKLNIEDLVRQTHIHILMVKCFFFKLKNKFYSPQIKAVSDIPL